MSVCEKKYYWCLELLRIFLSCLCESINQSLLIRLNMFTHFHWWWFVCCFGISTKYIGFTCTCLQFANAISHKNMYAVILCILLLQNAINTSYQHITCPCKNLFVDLTINCYSNIYRPLNNTADKKTIALW